jgi:hypothetical protein
MRSSWDVRGSSSSCVAALDLAARGSLNLSILVSAVNLPTLKDQGGAKPWIVTHSRHVLTSYFISRFLKIQGCRLRVEYLGLYFTQFNPCLFFSVGHLTSILSLKDRR